MADDALFTIAGQEFKVTSPERVFYPATGTGKLDVIGYYAEGQPTLDKAQERVTKAVVGIP